MYNLSYLPELEINQGGLNLVRSNISENSDYFLSKITKFEKYLYTVSKKYPDDEI